MIYIFGAGSIGAYLGGLLASAGVDVVLLGRQRLVDRVAASGLRCSDYLGNRASVSADEISIETEPHSLARADAVLVTVKSGDTVAAAETIAAHCRDQIPVFSFQNGVRNAATLREICSRQQVVAGMVPFNVIEQDGSFHRGTEGTLYVEDVQAVDAIEEDFHTAHFPLTRHRDMDAVLWGKLVTNLINPVNALGDKPIKAQLGERSARRLLALTQAEGLSVLKAAGIRAVSFTGFPNSVLLLALRAPDWIYNRVMKRAVNIDEHARSSMWQDLEQGRKTEIDFLNGEIIRVAEQHGMEVPANRKITALIKAAEQGGPRNYDADTLFALCTGD